MSPTMYEKAIDRGRAKAIALAAMCLAVFAVNLDGTVVDVALPAIQTNLGANMLGLQWILNGYALPVASLLLSSGTVGDLYGRKRVFLAGLAIFTFASLLCGLAPNLASLIAGRVLQGIGAAALLPLSLTILTDMFPDPQEKAKVIGVWSAVSGLSLIAGPGLGGIIVDNLGWQSIFFLNIPLGAFAFWITARFIERDGNRKKPRVDVLGLAFSTMFLGTLTYALTEGSVGVWYSSHILWLLAIAGLSLIAFLGIESRINHPMLPLQLFKNPTFAIANLIPVMVFFTSGSSIFIFSLFLQQVKGFSASATGMFFLPMNIAIILSAFVSGWLVARLGWRFPVIGGLALASAATFALTRINADTEYSKILLSLILSGFGGGLTIAPLAATVMNSVLPIQEGIASGIFNMGIQLGGVLGIALQGTIFMQRLASDLERSLSQWNLPANLHRQLIDNALQGSAQVPDRLPDSISKGDIHHAIEQAFLSGLHATIPIASFILLAGALLIAAFAKPMVGARSHLKE